MGGSWRRAAAWVFLGAALQGAFACGPEARRTAPPGAPSVLLVSIDTVRADRVGAYGARDAGTAALMRQRGFPVPGQAAPVKQD